MLIRDEPLRECLRQHPMGRPGKRFLPGTALIGAPAVRFGDTRSAAWLFRSGERHYNLPTGPTHEHVNPRWRDPRGTRILRTDDYSLADERRDYLEGVRLFNEGDFFGAHETWEDCWNGTHDRRRERFYRAVIRGAVTLHLLRQGRAVGCRQVFVDCVNTFEGLPPVFMGLDIARHIENLRGAIRPALDDLEARQVRIDPARLFKMELRGDPFEALCDQ